jgi:hypothetical protein
MRLERSANLTLEETNGCRMWIAREAKKWFALRRMPPLLFSKFEN